jgi:hypothetical protein
MMGGQALRRLFYVVPRPLPKIASFATQIMNLKCVICVEASGALQTEMANSKTDGTPDWEKQGIRIVRSGELDRNTPQTGAMPRAQAISHARVGAQKPWAGTFTVQAMPGPDAIGTGNSKP